MIPKIAENLVKRGWYLSTAESCTGGKLAAAIIEYPGSSLFFDRGLVVYSNLAKHEELMVSEEILKNYGAVSRETALAMVEGLFLKTKDEVVFSITGLAGPTGGSSKKPVGLVYFGWGILGNFGSDRLVFNGNRQVIQWLAVKWAVNKLLELLC